MNKPTSPILFRAVSANTDFSRLNEAHKTMRPPLNVPYIVDNLWEWKRPHEYPNRRFSVFASPTKALAIASAGTEKIPCTVELTGRFKICQLYGSQAFNNEDSKYHSDCRKLREILLNKLGQSWIDGTLAQKKAIGRLWMPCLRKEEVDSLFESVETLHQIRDEIFSGITYWNDIVLLKESDSLPDERGEVFFEPVDGYWLHPLGVIET
jgi:hypothetical protein